MRRSEFLLIVGDFLKRFSALRRAASVCWMTALAAACLLGGVSPAMAQPTDYQLGPGDTVRITVFQSQDLTTEARISETGTVSFPLIGAVRLGGLTAAEAEALIARRLRDGSFIQNPQVTLLIQQFRSQQVAVLGNVGRPGRYPIEVKGTRLTDILAAAGGILPTGADVLVLMRRDAGGKIARSEIDVPSLFLDNRPELDVVLQGGDSLYVHRAPTVYVFGQVQRPGQFQLERDMTVGQAIAKGGGFTLRARESGIRLKRRDAAGRITEAAATLDDPVRADDQIFVRESLF